MSDKDISIVIGGDFVPTESNRSYFEKSDIEGLLGDKCFALFSASDLNIINLEAPLADSSTPIMKWGPNLLAPTSSIDFMKKLRIDVAGLANNHILDQGRTGLCSTIETLDKAGIKHVGAGLSLERAKRVLNIPLKKKIISIYACAEHEFSTADIDGIGANPFDPFESFDHIREAKKTNDFLIVLYHGGIEQYRYPTARIQKIAHKCIEAGADIFICQHTHCIGAYEKYKNKTIVYGQGNFLFDGKNNEFWNSGLLLNISIGNTVDVDFIPIVKRGRGLSLAEGQERQNIIDSFLHRSEEITQIGFIEEKLKEFSRENISEYMRFFGGKLTGNTIFRGLDKLTKRKLTRLNYKDSTTACIIDILRCESLNDLVGAGCIENLKEIVGKR